MLTVSAKVEKLEFRAIAITFLSAYAALFIITLNSYIHWQSVNFITGMFAIPIVAKNTSNVNSYRYGIVALIFCFISILLPISTILYFAFLFAFLFIIESFYGRTDFLLLLILIFLSPVFQFFINVFSFPIRLQLTDWAGKIMSATGLEVGVQGNIIFYRENEFSVDAACMGLNMLLLSLIIAVVFMGYYKMASKRKLLSLIPLVLVLTLVLNVVANLLRIICMVLFTILPNSALHDITGLLFFIVYIIFPLHFIVKKISSQSSSLEITSKVVTSNSVFARKIWITNSLLLILLLISSSRNLRLKDNNVFALKTSNMVEGYSTQYLPHHVLKLEKKGILVYIKKIPAFYSADHTPYICWSGSGYTFENIEKQVFEGNPVYTGKLKSDQGELFTAWWYQSKEKITINQMVWRLDMLRGKGDYYVFNITAATKEEVVREVTSIFNKNPFVHLLN